MSRVLTGFVAVLSALLLALTTAPTAVQAQEAKAKPDHVVKKLKAGEVNNSGKFYVSGKAVTFKGKKIKLQRSGSENGHYRTIESTRTAKKNGRFRMVFKGPVGTWYRLLLNKTKDNATTKIIIGEIVRQRVVR